jgi:hypothetical protein
MYKSYIAVGPRGFRATYLLPSKAKFKLRMRPPEVQNFDTEVTEPMKLRNASDIQLISSRPQSESLAIFGDAITRVAAPLSDMLNERMCYWLINSFPDIEELILVDGDDGIAAFDTMDDFEVMTYVGQLLETEAPVSKSTLYGMTTATHTMDELREMKGSAPKLTFLRLPRQHPVSPASYTYKDMFTRPRVIPSIYTWLHK